MHTPGHKAQPAPADFPTGFVPRLHEREIPKFLKDTINCDPFADQRAQASDRRSKPSNPKDAVGIRKLAFSVLPWRVLTGVALGMMEGAAKYGRHNYRAVGVRASVYFDAVVGRHLTDWWEGVDIDPDSGLHHIDKAIAGLMVLRDSMYQGNFTDDRPPCGNVDMAALNEQAAAILDRHADKSPHHYTIADGIK